MIVSAPDTSVTEIVFRGHSFTTMETKASFEPVSITLRQPGKNLAMLLRTNNAEIRPPVRPNAYAITKLVDSPVKSLQLTIRQEFVGEKSSIRLLPSQLSYPTHRRHCR